MILGCIRIISKASAVITGESARVEGITKKMAALRPPLKLGAHQKSRPNEQAELRFAAALDRGGSGYGSGFHLGNDESLLAAFCGDGTDGIEVDDFSM